MIAARHKMAALAVVAIATSAFAIVGSDIKGTTLQHSAPASPDDQGELSGPLSIAEILPPSPSTSEVIWVASELLKQRCMAERGFDYDPLPSPGYEQSWATQRDAQLMTAERAATIAYHHALMGDPPELQAAYVELEQRAGDAAYLSALGAQPGEANELGCSHVAREALDVGIDLSSDDFNQIIGDAEQQVFDAVASDPDHRAALGAWASCMATGGYAYESPDDAFADPQWTTTPEPSDLERNTALHDASCRDQSGLNRALREAQHHAVSSWIDANPAIVEGLRDAESALLARAQSVLTD